MAEGCLPAHQSTIGLRYTFPSNCRSRDESDGVCPRTRSRKDGRSPGTRDARHPRYASGAKRHYAVDPGAPGDISGDSDSLLSGLLRSGSYTVDALELAGADPRRLQEFAHDSIWAPLVDDGGEGLRTFFHVCSASQALLSHGARKGSLETADIVRYAIAPVGLGEFGETGLEGGSLDDAIRRLVLDRLREIVISQL